MTTKQELERLQAGLTNGNAEDINDLALCYLKGDGVAQDIARAIRLLEQAAAAGNPAITNNLAAAYRDVADKER